MNYRVLVCGGRDLDEVEANRWLVKNGKLAVARALGVPVRQVRISLIISGTARGGDRAGERWAEHLRCPIQRFKPDWDRYPKAAGIIRNGEMLEQGKPDCVLGLPGGRGTANMIERSRAAGIPVFEAQFQ